MRRVVVAVLGVLVVGLMLTPSVSAGVKTVYVTDRSGDLGHPVFLRVVDGMINPANFWSDNSPVGKATYLDVVKAWMTLTSKENTVTAGIQVSSPIPEAGPLPDGVRAIWWVWWFYLDTESWQADLPLVVSWDGTQARAYLVDQTDHGNTPYPFTVIDTCEIKDNTVSVVVDRALVPNAVAWFYEVIVWTAYPVSPDNAIPMGGWYAVDMTDSPADTMLPWWPMP